MAKKKIVLRGRGLTSGRGEGEAIVHPRSIAVGSIVGGVVRERGSPIFGQRTVDKVCIFRNNRGTTHGATSVVRMVHDGTAPRAIVYLESEPIVVGGALMAQELYGKTIPIVDRLDKNPLEVIENGDFVTVDADKGEVTIAKK
ncbi:MAG: aconitase X swivel domain-containing protein [Candidatus Bathyarchaeia archaeon]